MHRSTTISPSVYFFNYCLSSCGNASFNPSPTPDCICYCTVQSCKFGTAVYESSHSVSIFLDLLKQCKQLISDETCTCLIQGTGEEINMHTELSHKCASLNPVRFGCKMLYTSANNTICAVPHMPTLCCINRFTWSSLGEIGPVFDPHRDEIVIL